MKELLDRLQGQLPDKVMGYSQEDVPPRLWKEVMGAFAVFIENGDISGIGKALRKMHEYDHMLKRSGWTWEWKADN